MSNGFRPLDDDDYLEVCNSKGRTQSKDDQRLILSQYQSKKKNGEPMCTTYCVTVGIALAKQAGIFPNDRVGLAFGKSNLKQGKIFRKDGGYKFYVPKNNNYGKFQIVKTADHNWDFSQKVTCKVMLKGAGEIHFLMED